jgi:hypothetical protein
MTWATEAQVLRFNPHSSVAHPSIDAAIGHPVGTKHGGLCRYTVVHVNLPASSFDSSAHHATLRPGKKMLIKSGMQPINNFCGVFHEPIFHQPTRSHCEAPIHSNCGRHCVVLWRVRTGADWPDQDHGGVSTGRWH